MHIKNAPNGESLTLNLNSQYYIAGPIEMPLGVVNYETFMDNINPDPALLTSSFKNLGLALDLGATNKFNDDFTFGAAINDLGFITWKSQVYKVDSESEVEWRGADLSNSVNKNDPNYVGFGDAFQNAIDTLENSVDLVTSATSYTRMLNASFNLHAMYHVNQRFNVSAMLRGVMMGDKFYPSMTIGANARPVRNLGISVTYSIYQGNYANIGVGISPRFGCFQPYLVVDNILSANVMHARSAHVRFGLNFVGSALFGKRAHKAGRGQAWRAM